MEPTQTSPQNSTPKAESQLKLSIPAAIIIAGVIIAGAVFLSGRGGVARVDNGGDTEVAPAKVNVKDVTVAGEPFIGQENAVAVAYFSDYQCPFCKKFDDEVLGKLKTDYVDTGKIKIIFKDFAFLGDDSTTGAIFGRAIWDLYPAQYFTWREAMVASQDEEHGGFGDRASIEKLITTIQGIDQKKVSAAVDTNMAKYKKLIEDSYAEGQRLGVQGTPSVIIGKVMIDGAYPLNSYIEALKKVVK
ncbi:MAG: thioredoxin domain-containing protein [Candidatus Pacebacteria bacterium]|nr:thioredoxin domain-containing protein [Candidatus Paceibacterota bacterium]